MTIEFVKDISVVIGLWVVFYKIAAWQIEHRGRRNIELAEETLALFYEAKDVLEWIRHPVAFGEEIDSVKKEENESTEEFEARKKVNFIFVRFNKNKELFSKIHSLRYRFMAQIGKEKAMPFTALDGLIKEIISAARLLTILWTEKNILDEEARKVHYNQIKMNRSIIWDSFDKQDPINVKMEAIIVSIEAVCQEVIMAKGTLHGFLNSRLKKK